MNPVDPSSATDASSAPISGQGFNPYSAPTANVDVQARAISEQWLYVVAPRKFLLLMVLTFGIYSVYWFYKNWALLNVHHKAYWPVPRAIFSIFFTHSLFGEVDSLLRKRGIDYRWSPGSLATTYVIAVLASRVLDRFSQMPGVSPILAFVSVLTIVPVIGSLYSAQLAINAAESDPRGECNAEISAANILWMLLGMLVWMMILLGIWVTLVNPDF